MPSKAFHPARPCWDFGDGLDAGSSGNAGLGQQQVAASVIEASLIQGMKAGQTPKS